MYRRYFAHTLDGRPQEEWQGLPDHLEAVGEAAAQFASTFGAADWARLVGLWHDLGKYSDAFQDYLRTVAGADSHVAESTRKVDHSTAGAQHAVKWNEILGHLLAFVIAGHHSGLLNGPNDGKSKGASMENRLKKEIETIHAPSDLLAAPPLALPRVLESAFNARDPFAVAFFTRMLFSCLVDADFLDTEAFMNSERSLARPKWPADILERMALSLDTHIKAMQAKDTLVNQQRTVVRQACLEAASQAPGFFSLTVPTGGGKTLSSLAFALKHAAHHGLQRVIYVVPFTTIIEQNADAFRKVMKTLVSEGIPDPIVEHHSNLDAENETVASRLASENWDAPLVVTTSVQFYESMFANRTSRCRKLHNLARAVVVLDEAQTLPVDFLQPCLRSLQELSSGYGTTIVLCTATQPAVQRRDDFTIGLQGVREIIPDPQRLYLNLKRVQVQDLGKQSDQELAQKLLARERGLCIVNTRSHARKLFESLGDAEGHFHLSALMCPEHRSALLREIRSRLRDPHQVCRVVSTQLVEAGVDLDFPVVYRSLAGLDSIAQAAGRCNRNGGLEGLGQTFVFRSEHVRSERFFTDTADCASSLLPLYEDPLSLDALEHYFRLYFWEQKSRWDTKKVMLEFHLLQEKALPFSFNFANVAKLFRLIEDSGEPVIIPWGNEGDALCKKLRDSWETPNRALLRKLQRYTVNIPRRLWEHHIDRKIERVHERYPVLVSPEIHYSERTGLVLEEDLPTFLNA